jgi:FKBP-type peptidyl-prolyl cis-trans isomerase SlyD
MARLTDVSAPTISPNAYVTLDYVLKDGDGEVLDTSDGEGGEPIAYVHGYGMLVPGLEAGLVGLRIGEERDILVPAEAGYGDRDEELVMEVDRADFPDPAKVEEGDEFVAESPDGDEVVMRVVELRPESVVVDANHPLAGVALHYSVKVLTVRVATEEEIASAAADFEEAVEHEHVHGPECGGGHGHSHGEGDSELVTLGRKKAGMPN